MKDFVVKFLNEIKAIEGKDMQAMKGDPVVIGLQKLVTDTLAKAYEQQNVKEQLPL